MKKLTSIKSVANKVIKEFNLRPHDIYKSARTDSNWKVYFDLTFYIDDKYVSLYLWHRKGTDKKMIEFASNSDSQTQFTLAHRIKEWTNLPVKFNTEVIHYQTTIL